MTSNRVFTTSSSGWRRWPDTEIEAYIARYEDLESTQYDEYLIQLLDDMEQELADREEFRDNGQAAYDENNVPSLQDQGNYLGSYDS